MSALNDFTKTYIKIEAKKFTDVLIVFENERKEFTLKNFLERLEFKSAAGIAQHSVQQPRHEIEAS